MAERSTVEAVTAFGAGLLFAIGLGIAGMTNPAKVLGFLDLGGDWDPSLLLVMGAAVPVHAVAWWILRRRGGPLLGGPVPRRPAPIFDARLLGGSALFGVGWGLAGVCPGPGVVSAVTGGSGLLFVGGLALGVAASRLVAKPPALEEREPEPTVPEDTAIVPSA